MTRPPVVVLAVLLAAAAGVVAGPATADEPAPVLVLSDVEGDANGVSPIAPTPSTSPASVDTADLRSVRLERVADGLQMRFGLSALPALDGSSLQTFYRLSATLGECRFHVGVLLGSLTPTGEAAGLQPFFDPVSGCPDGTEIIQAEPEWTGAADADTVELVASFPLDSLGEHVPGLVPGATLTGITADVGAGTYLFAGGTTTPDAERYSVVVLDAAPGGLEYAVPCTTEQEC